MCSRWVGKNHSVPDYLSGLKMSKTSKESLDSVKTSRHYLLNLMFSRLESQSKTNTSIPTMTKKSKNGSGKEKTKPGTIRLISSLTFCSRNLVFTTPQTLQSQLHKDCPTTTPSLLSNPTKSIYSNYDLNC